MLTRAAWVYLAATIVSLFTLYALVEYTPSELFGQASPKQRFRTGLSPPSYVAPNGSDGLEDVLGPLEEYEDGFTMISPTYHNTAALLQYLDNYATGLIPSLRRIIVIWNNEQEPTAPQRRYLTNYPVPVEIEHRASNSSNERFRRTDSIATAAVLSLDDDTLIDPGDVEHAFQRWRTHEQSRKQTVGLLRRTTNIQRQRRKESGTPAASLEQLAASFLHVDWLDLWWADLDSMKNVRDYVDSRKLDDFPDLQLGCENIAMAYLHVQHTQTPPLWLVGATFREIDVLEVGHGPASPGYLEGRKACVKHLAELFRSDVLGGERVRFYPIHDKDAEE